MDGGLYSGFIPEPLIPRRCVAQPSFRYIHQHQPRGFSLAEMVLVLLLLSLLAALAQSGYQGYTLHSERAAIQQQLLALQLRQLHFYRQHGHYAESVEQLSPLAAAPAAPTADESDGDYQLLIAVETAPPRFTLTAERAVDASEAESRCRQLSVDQSGQRQPAGCW